MKNLHMQCPVMLSIAVICCFLLFFASLARAAGIQVTDDLGRQISWSAPPERAVSLVPSVTEIIFALDAGPKLVGVTQHNNQPAEVHSKQIVGGFLTPCIRKITSLQPDVVFAAQIQADLLQKLLQEEIQVVFLQTESVAGSFADIGLLARILDREAQGRDLVQGIKEQLQLIEQKTARIPDQDRKRVIRLMGREQIMTPGVDSFQNELIRKAGGIAPEFQGPGAVVSVSKEQWQDFDPQVIYGCGGDRQLADTFFSSPGWRDVQAVQDGAVYWFPCELTCRAASGTGAFVSWLASRIYTREFLATENFIFEQAITGSRSIKLDLDYVQQARIAQSRIADFANKTLIIDLIRPMTVVSTLEGQLQEISRIGNHFSPAPSWSLGHHQGLDWVRSQVYAVIQAEANQSSFLFTGADMDNLSIQKERYQDLAVYALVTAGVSSNAQRMSRDSGSFYKPGTINIIILPSMQLSPRAMTRAIITATEAKTAALQDLDIRSAYSGRKHQATGTGTDNILVAEGDGQKLHNAGGHSKLGELIAGAVHAGVQEAISRQNGLVPHRSVFHRLQERGLQLYEFVNELQETGKLPRQEMHSALYCTLLQPKYAHFVLAAMSLDDEREKGLLQETEAFTRWTQGVAAEISGRVAHNVQKMVPASENMSFLEQALISIVTAIRAQAEQKPADQKGAADENHWMGPVGAADYYTGEKHGCRTCLFGY